MSKASLPQRLWFPVDPQHDNYPFRLIKLKIKFMYILKHVKHELSGTLPDFQRSLNSPENASSLITSAFFWPSPLSFTYILTTL